MSHLATYVRSSEIVVKALKTVANRDFNRVMILIEPLKVVCVQQLGRKAAVG